MAIKLVAIDIDGTLITDTGEITQEVFQAIQEAKQQGVKIVITTGRPMPGVEKYLEELNLKDAGDYVITYNGGLVQETKTGKEFIRYTLTHDDYLEIDALARKLHVHLHTTTNDTIYTSNRDISPYTVHEAFLVNMPLAYRTQEEITEEFEIVKMMMIDEEEILTKVIHSIPDSFKEKFTTVRSAPYYFEILNKKASKGAALIALAEKLGIDISETMAIGDADNDLSMLEAAGTAVAMANATENVKAIADVHTTSNNDSGVAKAIWEVVLG
ncbi:MAG: sugar-phosphatase [Lactobacillales bacterium]|jgi:Cof subfamily protein (haloacid dehalogenase superfamily)|nr:sugar-phosphatase [Lactobacillales bacterium]